jgi:hypothetical protein
METQNQQVFLVIHLHFFHLRRNLTKDFLLSILSEQNQICLGHFYNVDKPFLATHPKPIGVVIYLEQISHLTSQ